MSLTRFYFMTMTNITLCTTPNHLLIPAVIRDHYSDILAMPSSSFVAVPSGDSSILFVLILGSSFGKCARIKGY